MPKCTPFAPTDNVGAIVWAARLFAHALYLPRRAAPPIINPEPTVALARPFCHLAASCKRLKSQQILGAQIDPHPFRFSSKHDKDAVQRILGEYSGYLVADAHTVYDHLYATGNVVEVACCAHTRRYFFKAMSSEPERAREALAMIGQLFRIERALAGKTTKQRKRTRQAKSKAAVESFFRWCEDQRATAIDETPLAKGLGYALNQRAALMRFLDDGRLPLDNNVSERELRREAIGRKNWLFVGNDEAGEVNATFVTLIASCQLHGLEPWAGGASSSSLRSTGARLSSRRKLSRSSAPTSAGWRWSISTGTRDRSSRRRAWGHDAARRTDTIAVPTAGASPARSRARDDVLPR